MATDCQGGYEYDFVDADSLPDRIVCQICHYPCREARLTGCCGAHFCSSRLKQIRKGPSMNKACPICRAEKFKDFPNKQLDREIKGMRVYCLNRQNGCTWVGEINDVTTHLDVDCQFVDVYCPSRCGTKMKRQCVDLHLAKDCPCYCKYCGASGSEIASRHKEHCHVYPVPCPNGCELGITGLVKINKHRKICPLEVVQCEYHDMGCMAKVLRKDLEKHINKSMSEHFNLLKTHLANTTNALRKTESKLSAVAKDLADTKKSLDKTRSNFSKLNEKITQHGRADIDQMVTDQKLEDINEDVT